MHTREQHVLRIDEFLLMTYYEIRIFLRTVGFLLTLPDRCAFFSAWHTHVAIHIECNLRGICLTIEQRTVAILIAAEIASECEDVLWRVLVHRRVGRRTYHYDRIAGITDHKHQKTQQNGILCTRCDIRHDLLLYLTGTTEQEIKQSKNNHTDDCGRPSVAVERYAEHTHGQDECYILPLEASARVCFVYSPDNRSNKKDDVYDLTCVERTSQNIYKEKLEPSTNSHNARHNTIKHGRNDDKRDDEGCDRTLQLDVREATIAIYKHDGRYAKQVEKVHTDGKSRHICNEHKPAVAVRFVGVILPFEDEPEHDCGES